METRLRNRPVGVVREVWLLRLRFCVQGAWDLAGAVDSRVGRGLMEVECYLRATTAA